MSTIDLRALKQGKFIFVPVYCSFRWSAEKSHFIGDVFDPTWYENHNTDCTNMMLTSFHPALFLPICFITSLVHTSIQRDVNSGADLEADPCIYARWGKQNTRKVMLSNVPMLFYIALKVRWDQISLFLEMRMAFSPITNTIIHLTPFLSQNLLYRVVFPIL